MVVWKRLLCAPPREPPRVSGASEPQWRLVLSIIKEMMGVITCHWCLLETAARLLEVGIITAANGSQVGWRSPGCKDVFLLQVSSIPLDIPLISGRDRGVSYSSNHVRSRKVEWKKHTVLVFLECYNKIPQTGGEQKTFLSHGSGGWEIQG